MAEARDKIETFKNILLELQVSNETLDKINTNTLNASEMGLEAAVGIESLVANKSSSGSSGSDSILKCLENIAQDSLRMVNSLNAISQILSDTLEMNKSKNLADEEARLEAQKNNKEQTQIGPKNEKMEGGLGIMGTIAAIAGLVTGFVVGIVTALTEAFAVAMSAISKFLKLDSLLAKIGLSSSKIIGWFKPLTDGLKELSVGISEGWAFVKAAISESALVKNIKKFFEPLKDLFQFFSKEGSIISKIIGWGGKVSSWFTKLTEIFGLFFRVGKVFGKLTGYIGIAISVFDAINDAFKVFSKTGDISAAIETGVTGFINAFTGGILDLFKDAISWMAGALGFKEVEKGLDSFSFADLIGTFIHRFIQMGTDVFETYFQNIIDVFGDVYDAFASGNIMGGLDAMLTGFLKTVVAVPLDIVKGVIASIAGWFGAKDVEKSIRSYSFAESLGGTHTKTAAETRGPSASIWDESKAATIAKRIAKEKAKETEKKQSELEDFKNPIDSFYDQLLTAYKQNADGTVPAGVTPANANTVGAQIDALSTDTKEQNDNSYYAARGGSAAPSMSRSNTVSNSNNNSVVTVNSSNMPDRVDNSFRGIFAR